MKEPGIKDTERGVVARVAGEINEYIHQGAWPEFGEARVEESISSGFPDMIIRLADGKPFAVAEFKLPSKTPHTDYKNALRKAQALNCEYFITSNFNQTTIWSVPGNRVERFGPVGLASLDELMDKQKEIALFSSWEAVMNLLAGLKREGILALTPASQSRFFTELITQRTKDLLPEFGKAFGKAIKNAEFLKELRAWAAPQGIPTEPSELVKVSSMQALYRLIIKIMFYFAMRRYWPDRLPPFESVNSENISESLSLAFREALTIDFHAVFEEDTIDRVPLTQKAREDLSDLVSRLRDFHFETAPLDVVGTIYENLIPHEDRYKLGQYFTPVPVVDLIITLTVNSGNNVQIIDPTCGTGTFLQRCYDWFRNRHGTRRHEEIIPRLWGVDIARFPAELATVNLYRQDPSRYEVFPRIIREDFMALSPGQAVEFKHPLENRPVQESLPRFTAIVGNPPYVRQENIERVSGGYKKTLAEVLKGDGYTLEIKGTTDIFVFIFLHALKHLRERGRLGFITSNAYASTEYGVEFKKALLDNYTLRYIVSSWAEPWFTQVEVNTMITVVENLAPMDTDPVHFVSLKRPLDELAPEEPFQSGRHWQRLHALKALIDAAPFRTNKTLRWRGEDMNIYEDEAMRVLCVAQKSLLPEENWMVYLRAPDVYFELMEKAGEKLVRLGEVADLRFGLKCGIKEFFILSDQDVEVHKIEPELLRPVITSPSKIKNSLVAEPDAWLFVCDLDMADLKRHYPNAWRYVKDGETRETKGGHQQKRRGVKFPDVPSVKHFKRWYTLPEPPIGDFAVPRGFGERLFIACNDGGIIFSDRFNHGTYRNQESAQFYNAYLNSSLSFLFLELSGRIAAGAGVLDFQQPNVADILVPDLSHISETYREKIVSAYAKLKARAPLKISQEVKQKDRQKLDRLVLEALGLSPEEYLPRLYEGLVRMVAERVGLGKLRKAKAKEARERDIQRIIDGVIESLVAAGRLRGFPEAFVPPRDLKQGDVVPLPGKTLEREEFMGSLVLKSEGQKIEISDKLSNPKRLFVFYGAKPGRYAIRVPKDEKVVRKAIENFRAYARELEGEISARLAELTGDQITARNLTRRVLDELGLSVALNG